MLLTNVSFVHIRGKVWCSQMKHEAGLRQRNHSYPRLAKYVLAEDIIIIQSISWLCARKDVVWCIQEVIPTVMRQTTGTETSQKHVAWTTAGECAGNSERGIQGIERNIRSTLQFQYVASTYTQNEKALFTFTGHRGHYSCFLFSWTVETIRGILRTYYEKGTFSVGKL